MSQASKTQVFDSSDARAPVAQALDELQRKAFLEKRKQELLATARSAVDGARAAGAETEEASNAETIKFVAVAFAIVAVVALGSVYGIMWALDNF